MAERSGAFFKHITPAAPAIIYILFGVGVIGHLLEPTRDLLLAMTPYFLLFMAIFVLLPQVLRKNKKLFLWAAPVLISTFFIEALGVRTGLVFGAYEYGPTLGRHVLDVPPVIGLNWVIVMLGAILLAGRITRRAFPRALISGALAVFFDLVMEPVAIELDYWTWDNVAVPLQNYIAWGVIAFVISLAYSWARVDASEKRGSLLEHFFMVQVLFFALLDLLLVV
jgi:putative membrane protein